MKYGAEVKISLKKGVLNPEATTIQKALALLGYKVKETDTYKIIKFTLDEKDEEVAQKKVDEMCQRLLCNPVIHNYRIKIMKRDEK